MFDVILERYERGSILITSNRAPSEWPEIFQDPLIASAALDRLVDNAQIMIITGASYRARDRHFWRRTRSDTCFIQPGPGRRR